MTFRLFILFIILGRQTFSQTNKLPAANDSLEFILTKPVCVAAKPDYSNKKIEGTYSATSGSTTWILKLKSNGRLTYKRINDKEKSRVSDTGKYHLNKDTLFYVLNNQITLGGPLLFRDSCLLDLEDHKPVFIKIKK